MSEGIFPDKQGVDEADTESAAVSNMPVNRDYDWDEWVPTDVEPYVQQHEELDRMQAEIERATEMDLKPRFRLSGPSGTGKTLAARNLAAEDDAPLFTVQCKYAMHESDVTGMPVIVGDETFYVDGELTKAIQCSNERRTYVLVDEGNRLQTQAGAVFFQAFDDRCSVQLMARGGEIIEGNPHNLVVVFTMNEGYGHHVEDLDIAQEERLHTKHVLENLGRNNPEDAVELLTERTPVHETAAEQIVETANAVREAADDDETIIRRTLSTRALRTWACKTWNYANSPDLEASEDPFMAAAEECILTGIYDGEPGQSEVESIIRGKVGGAPYDADELTEWLDEADVSGDESDDDHPELQLSMGTVEFDGSLDHQERVEACALALGEGEYSPHHLSEAGIDGDTIDEAMEFLEAANTPPTMS